MQYLPRPDSCMNCNEEIVETDLFTSTSQLGYPLCINCHHELAPKVKKSTREALRLYFSLRRKGISAELEKFDGFKTVDIAIKDAKLNIELESRKPHYNPYEAIADLERDCLSFKKGYNTIRIPKELVAYDLEKTTHYLHYFVKVNRRTFF